MNISDFTPGTKVWGKIQDYPWWPGQVIRANSFPPHLARQKQPHNSVPVVFYGGFDSAFLKVDDLRLFKEERPDTLTPISSELQKALQDANKDPDPIELHLLGVIRQNVELAKKNQIERLEVEKRAAEAELEEQRTTKKAKLKRENIIREIDEVFDLNPSVIDRVKKLRYRLQAIFLNGKIEESLLEKAHEILRNIEQIPITTDILRQTKLGKVIKRIAKLELENDKHYIISRCQDLFDIWLNMVQSENN